MAKRSIEESTLTNIANAIRAKTGGTAKITPETMDEVLNSIPTQAAKTVTPSTADQTAVEKGVFTTGAVTVKGDENLKAENIAEGVSIFGVVGSHAGGGGFDTCTITIEDRDEGIEYCFFTTFVDGKVRYSVSDELPLTVEHVICGYPFFVRHGYIMLGVECTGGVVDEDGYLGVEVFYAPNEANAVGTVTLWDDD